MGAPDGSTPASPDWPLKLGWSLGLGATPGGMTTAELAESSGVGFGADDSGGIGLGEVGLGADAFGGVCFGATQGPPPASGVPPLHGPTAGE
ncbi:hypothetical protein ABZ806_12950 [Spirillospora sp. NPDC047418]